MNRDRAPSRRAIGLELLGAKNQKSAVTALEYYPRENKLFVLDVYDRIAVGENQTGDDALIELLQELRHSSATTLLGTSVPLSLPPCLTCTKKQCSQAGECTLASVKWMRDFTRKQNRNPSPEIRVLDFTPYTQRPVELWLRYQVLSKIEPRLRFEIDETIGGNKAPLSARMSYLKRHLPGMELIETNPKLSTVLLATELEIPRRIIQAYRHLEEGVHARTEILETLAEERGIFIYDRDLKKLATHLSAFDSFICAYTALLWELNECVKVPAGYPEDGGWVAYPEIVVEE